MCVCVCVRVCVWHDSEKYLTPFIIIGIFLMLVVVQLLQTSDPPPPAYFNLRNFPTPLLIGIHTYSGPKGASIKDIRTFLLFSTSSFHLSMLIHLLLNNLLLLSMQTLKWKTNKELQKP